MIRRLFPYYGAKHAYAKNYPAPRHGHIIEPFAGSAGYSHLWGETNRVTLVEKNPRLASIWRWLLSVSEDEFMSVPGIDTFNHIDETDLDDGPAREYVRQWCGVGSALGRDKVSALVKDSYCQRSSVFSDEFKPQFWSDVKRIRHWKVIEGDYTEAPNAYATWFIDPPYQVGGDGYASDCKVSHLDFDSLAEWSTSRSGDVIVCEGDGADWLDFDDLRRCFDQTSSKATGFGKTKRRELIWYARNGVKVSEESVRMYARLWKVKK